MTRRAVLHTAIVAVALGSLPPIQGSETPASGAESQTQSEEDVQRASEITQQAQELLEQGEWERAAGLLNQSLQGCQPERPSCLLLSYTMGYLRQKQSAAQPRRERELLELAARFYEQVLSARPQHGSTLKNLAFVYDRLGEESQVEHLQKAIERDPDNAYTYINLLASRYAKANEWDKALQYYDRAMKLAPDNEYLAVQSVNAYRRLPVSRQEELLKRCGEWEGRFPQASRRCYQAIIARHNESPGLADQAIIAWVELLARRATLSDKSLEDLPPSWSGPAAQGLKDYLYYPLEEPSSENWWMQAPRRRHAIGQAALALGEERLARGDHQWTARCWDVGLTASPTYWDYVEGELKDYPAVRLELHTQLASLYSKHPHLDVRGGRMRRVLAGLFEGKALAYKVGDLEAIQRHHTILGIIFAEKEVWDSEHPASEDVFHNAIFQLENAIETAAKRDRKIGFYQPLAKIKEYLARAYQVRQRSDAGQAYLNAAEAYLDSDDLRKAEEMLARTTADEFEKGRQLKRLLQLRNAIAQTSPDSISDAVELSPQGAPWLYDSNILAQGFLARQRFKVFSDLAARLPDEGEHAARALESASQALQEAISEGTALTGTGDVIRLEKVTKLLNKKTGFEEKGTLLKPSPENPSGTTIQILLPGENKPTSVQIEQDALVAQDITRNLGAAAVLEARRQATLRDGQINKPALNAYLRARSKEELGGYEGQMESLRLYNEALQALPSYAPAYRGKAEVYQALGRSGAISLQIADEQAQNALRRVEEIETTRGRETDPVPDQPTIRPDSARPPRPPSMPPEEPQKPVEPSEAASDLIGTATSLYMKRNFQETSELLRDALKRDSDALAAHRLLEKIDWQQGNDDEAFQHLFAITRLSDADADTLQSLRGESSKGREALLGWKLDWTIREFRRGKATPYDIAEVCVLQGDLDAAVRWLLPALRQEKPDQVSPGLLRLQKDPVFEPLRADPRYKRLLSLIGQDR